MNNRLNRRFVFLPVSFAGILALASFCGAGQIALSREICEIAVRDVRASKELRRIKQPETIGKVTAILRAPRSRKSTGGTLPAGRFNLLFYACQGPVDQLAIGINFISDYQAKRVYELSASEKSELRRLLGLRF